MEHTLSGKELRKKVSIGYKEMAQEEESLTLPETIFVKNKDRRCLCREESISETFCFRKETIGLRHFCPLIMFIKKYTSSLSTWFLFPNRKLKSNGSQSGRRQDESDYPPILSGTYFDYRTGNDFVYNGDKNLWLLTFGQLGVAPCMRLLPKMEELAEKYKGKVMFIK